MPRKTRDLATRAERFAEAWGRFFPTKTFSGLTLEQFRETFKPCREVRLQLAQLASQSRNLLFRRRRLDRAAHPTLVRVFLAVRADPETGEDTSMFSAMGYIPHHRRRKPGRKRKPRATSRTADASSPTTTQQKRRRITSSG